MINALYLHCRARSFALGWERFQAEYQVFDALYYVANAVKPFKRRITHSGRFYALARRYHLTTRSAQVARIVRLRNSLLHEGLWDGQLIGDEVGRYAYNASYPLHNLTSRLALAILGVRGHYIGSGWWGNGNSRWHIE